MFSLISKSCLWFLYIKKIILKYLFIQQIRDTYIKGSLILCRTKLDIPSRIFLAVIMEILLCGIFSSVAHCPCSSFSPYENNDSHFVRMRLYIADFFSSMFSPSVLLWEHPRELGLEDTASPRSHVAL